jgi:hypothetical protein
VVSHLELDGGRLRSGHARTVPSGPPAAAGIGSPA